MANFRTHISVAAAGGAVIAHAGWQAGLWDFMQSLPVLALTTFGGILPDIDSDTSTSIRLIFNLLAVPAVVAGAVMLQDKMVAGMLVLVCGAIYVAVRYLASAVFARFTVHRGIWHSLLAALTCGLAASAVSFGLFQRPETLAWMHGLALFAGFIIHLLLDELYSVDLSGARLKRSFGTALKPIDVSDLGASLAMLCIALFLFPWLPGFGVLYGMAESTASALYGLMPS
ncbi:metal-dependent hydrolase [Halomonas huangheensis]|uniref:Uncharacterized protein n=1 Tax=Halomonas huangheensis TaxID=1178482 RepID=W1N6D0_9GAMM|nr:metal-dependent hydrolase [Halomonas huangheensis]ALM51114.1 hypothetical protein AR456_01500 [Halomonas huangheensis]ERL51127.1 hypothetical protein BJB45_14580 [Halomonas huangheensis]